MTERVIIFTASLGAGGLAVIDESLVSAIKDGPAILLIALLFGAQMYLNKLSSDKQAEILRETLKSLSEEMSKLSYHMYGRPCMWMEEHKQKEE